MPDWWTPGKQPKDRKSISTLLKRATSKADRLDAQGYRKKGNLAPKPITLPSLKCLKEPPGGAA